MEHDIMGNLLFKYEKNYYYLHMSDEILLEKICDPKIFKPDDDQKQNYVHRGVIHSGKISLRGKVLQKLSNIDPTELSSMNIYDVNKYFPERKLYWVEKNDTDSDDDLDDGYAINGNYLNISDINMMSYSSHDTIIIKGNKSSKHVLFTMERRSACFIRLTIYTDGIVSVNPIGENIKEYKLVITRDDIPRFVCI